MYSLVSSELRDRCQDIFQDSSIIPVHLMTGNIEGYQGIGINFGINSDIKSIIERGNNDNGEDISYGNYLNPDLVSLIEDNQLLVCNNALANIEYSDKGGLTEMDYCDNFHMDSSLVTLLSKGSNVMRVTPTYYATAEEIASSCSGIDWEVDLENIANVRKLEERLNECEQKGSGRSLKKYRDLEYSRSQIEAAINAFCNLSSGWYSKPEDAHMINQVIEVLLPTFPEKVFAGIDDSKKYSANWNGNQPITLFHFNSDGSILHGRPESSEGVRNPLSSKFFIK